MFSVCDTNTSIARWVELEETPPGGQWEYFSLDRYMPMTQESPK